MICLENVDWLVVVELVSMVIDEVEVEISWWSFIYDGVVMLDIC